MMLLFLAAGVERDKEHQAENCQLPRDSKRITANNCEETRSPIGWHCSIIMVSAPALAFP